MVNRGSSLPSIPGIGEDFVVDLCFTWSALTTRAMARRKDRTRLVDGQTITVRWPSTTFGKHVEKLLISSHIASLGHAHVNLMIRSRSDHSHAFLLQPHPHSVRNLVAQLGSLHAWRDFTRGRAYMTAEQLTDSILRNENVFAN